MIRRLFLFSLFTYLILPIASVAQVRVGVGRIDPLRRANTRVSHKDASLAKRFTTPDSISFGSVPQAVYVYDSLNVSSTNSTLALLEAQGQTYNGFEMYPLIDEDTGAAVIPAKASTALPFCVAINPYWYQYLYPQGTSYFSCVFDLYYYNAAGTSVYEKDPIKLTAAPMAFDTNGPLVIKLLHGKTESLPIQLTSQDVDFSNLDTLTQYFYIENAESDPIQVTTAQCWGGVNFVGVLDRTTPFLLAPGQQVAVAVHFTPGIPDTTTHPQTGETVLYYYDEFVLGMDKACLIDFASNATATGYRPSRIAAQAPDEAVKSKRASTISAFPNPVTSFLRVRSQAGSEIELLDMLGRSQSRIVCNSSLTTLDCSALPSGNYILRVDSEILPVTISH